MPDQVIYLLLLIFFLRLELRLNVRIRHAEVFLSVKLLDLTFNVHDVDNVLKKPMHIFHSFLDGHPNDNNKSSEINIKNIMK